MVHFVALKLFLSPFFPGYFHLCLFHLFVDGFFCSWPQSLRLVKIRLIDTHEDSVILTFEIVPTKKKTIMR